MTNRREAGETRQALPGARPNRGTMEWPAPSPGWPLEAVGDDRPRGMTVPDRTPLTDLSRHAARLQTWCVLKAPPDQRRMARWFSFSSGQGGPRFVHHVRGRQPVGRVILPPHSVTALCVVTCAPTRQLTSSSLRKLGTTVLDDRLSVPPIFSSWRSRGRIRRPRIALGCRVSRKGIVAQLVRQISNDEQPVERNSDAGGKDE